MQDYPNYSPTDTTEQADVLQEPEVTYLAQQHSSSAQTRDLSYRREDVTMANFANLTKEEMDTYYESQKIRWDNQNALDFAEETGVEQGIHKKAVETAIRLKAKNMSIEEIETL